MPGFGTQLIPTGNPPLVYGNQGNLSSPLTIRNTDSNNRVWIGNASNIGVNQQSIPLEPGDSLSFDGSVSIYAVAETAPVIIAITPGGTSYTSGSVVINGPVTANISGTVDVSVQNATIDIVGAGGFILPGQLALGFNNAITVSTGPNSSVTIFSALDVSTYGSIVFRAVDATSNSVAAGAAVCAQWRFTWIDAIGNVLSQETISILLGMNLTIQLPIKGSKLQLELVNIGSAGTISYAGGNLVFVWGDYRTVDKPIVLSSTVSLGGLPAITGWTLVSPFNPAPTVSAWLANLQSTNIPGVASTQYLMPLAAWSGDVQGWYQQTGQALAHDATIIDLSYAVQGSIPPGTSFTGGIIQNLPLAVAASPQSIEYNSPPTQLAFAFEIGAAIGDTFLTLTGR